MHFSNQYERKIPVAEYSSLKKLKGAVIQELMQQYIVDKTMNMDRMMAVIDGVDAVSYEKRRNSLLYEICNKSIAERKRYRFPFVRHY